MSSTQALNSDLANETPQHILASNNMSNMRGTPLSLDATEERLVDEFDPFDNLVAVAAAESSTQALNSDLANETPQNILASNNVSNMRGTPLPLDATEERLVDEFDPVDNLVAVAAAESGNLTGNETSQLSSVNVPCSQTNKNSGMTANETSQPSSVASPCSQTNKSSGMTANETSQLSSVASPCSQTNKSSGVALVVHCRNNQSVVILRANYSAKKFDIAIQRFRGRQKLEDLGNAKVTACRKLTEESAMLFDLSPNMLIPVAETNPSSFIAVVAFENAMDLLGLVSLFEVNAAICRNVKEEDLKNASPSLDKSALDQTLGLVLVTLDSKTNKCTDQVLVQHPYLRMKEGEKSLLTKIVQNGHLQRPAQVILRRQCKLNRPLEGLTVFKGTAIGDQQPNLPSPLSMDLPHLLISPVLLHNYENQYYAYLRHVREKLARKYPDIELEFEKKRTESRWFNHDGPEKSGPRIYSFSIPLEQHIERVYGNSSFGHGRMGRRGGETFTYRGNASQRNRSDARSWRNRDS